MTSSSGFLTAPPSSLEKESVRKENKNLMKLWLWLVAYRFHFGTETVKYEQLKYHPLHMNGWEST